MIAELAPSLIAILIVAIVAGFTAHLRARSDAAFDRLVARVSERERPFFDEIARDIEQDFAQAQQNVTERIKDGTVREDDFRRLGDAYGAYVTRGTN